MSVYGTHGMMANLFCQLSSIGGTLGLFTGISVITFFEILWWFGYGLLMATRNTAKKMGRAFWRSFAWKPSTKVNATQDNTSGSKNGVRKQNVGSPGMHNSRIDEDKIF